MRNINTSVRTDLAYFLPHVSAALTSVILLQSEARLGFALQAEYRLKASWNEYNQAIMCWLRMDECRHYHTVIVFNWSVWCLVVMDPAARLSEGTRLFLLCTWVVKEKYRLLKPFSEDSLSCVLTQIIPQQGNYTWLVGL